jgi:aryl-alcohol dehydrogenase-like predicted oxidoreductase
MEQRPLGRSGLVVPIAGLGTDNFGPRIDQERSVRVVHAALDCGVTFIDTARAYGAGRSEEYIGVALKGRRDRAIVATKYGTPLERTPTGVVRREGTAFGSRSRILESVETSLRVLGTDYIDLLQLHHFDPVTPIDEVLRTLTSLIEKGQVRYIGCSNFAGWQLANAAWVSATEHLERFVTVQNEWSLLKRTAETELKPAAEHFGMSILPYYPLASGLLTGKVSKDGTVPEGSRLRDPIYSSVLNQENLAKVERLRLWAQEHGRTMTEVALSWLASQPVVGSVIAGATSPEQVQANSELTRADLTRAELDEIASLVG